MIKFGIVGFGNIGKRHAQHIINNPDAKLIAVADTNTRLKSNVTALGAFFFDNIDHLLTVEDIDVVNICTPNYLHQEHCIRALSKGFHALVEKPMALSVTECDAMIAATKQYEKKIFAVKQNRYNPPVQAVKKALDEQLLGEVFMVQVNCFWNRNKDYYSQSEWRGKKLKDGGCLFTQFSHFIDILYYLLGDVRPIYGTLDNFTHQLITEVEDTGSFVLRSDKGNALINFNFTTSTYASNMEGSITVMGSKGTVKIGGQYLNTIEFQNIQNTALPNIKIQQKANDYGTYKGSMSNHDKVIENVIGVLKRDEPIMTPAEEGRAVVDIIEAMYRIV